MPFESTLTADLDEPTRTRLGFTAVGRRLRCTGTEEEVLTATADLIGTLRERGTPVERYSVEAT